MVGTEVNDWPCGPTITGRVESASQILAPNVGPVKKRKEEKKDVRKEEENWACLERRLNFVSFDFPASSVATVFH